MNFLDRASPITDAIGSGVFDPTGANFTTFNLGTNSGDLPALPSIGGSGANGSASIRAAARNAGITGGTITPVSTTGDIASALPGMVGGGTSIAQSWFARGAIVVLGFVFVAVGLSQFRKG